MSLSIISDAVIIYDCESLVGGVGNKLVLNSQLVKHSLESLGVSTEINKPYIGFNGIIPDLTDIHLRLWYMSMSYPNIDVKENGGISLYMIDGVGNTAHWFIAGSDTYAGGWINVLQYTSSVPDLGSVDLTNIVEIGMVPRNGVKDGYLSDPIAGENVWIDYIRHSDGLICYGENWGIEDIAISDQAPGIGFGIVSGEKGILEVQGSLVYGTEANVTKYADDSVTIVFVDNVVKDGLYGIKMVGDLTNASEFELTNSVVLSNLNKYFLDLDDPNIYKLTLMGNLINGASDIHLLDNLMYSNVTANLFNKCGTIYPQGARFENNSINSTTGAIAGLNLDSLEAINGCKKVIYTKYFNKYALYLNASITGTITLDAHFFDGTGIDIYWAGIAGKLVIKLINGSNASTYNTAGGEIELLPVDTVAIDYAAVQDMFNISNADILSKIDNSDENISALLLALGENVDENQSVIVSKSGNTQMFL